MVAAGAVRNPVAQHLRADAHLGVADRHDISRRIEREVDAIRGE